MAEASPAKYIAEFVGTFALVFTIGCNVISSQGVWGGVSIACVLTVMIYALGKSSGANFNPAVSFALGLNGNMQWAEVGRYAGIQLAAGMAAGTVYSLLFVDENFRKHVLDLYLEPNEGHTWLQAGLAELLYTFMLCFVVLNTAASKEQGGKNQFYGIAIGFVVVAGAYGAGSISKGCFNPAVAIGIDFSTAKLGFFNWVYYALYELVGAAAAVGCFHLCRPEERIEQADIPEIRKQLEPRLFSEFLGTYFLVLTVGLNVLGASTAGAFSIASALMCMIFALGSVSGAHFNPAVTTAILVSGREKCSAKDGVAYMIAQVLGGIAAAFTYRELMNGKTFPLKPESSHWQQVIVAETVFTFVLAFVVLSIATVKNPLSQYFGLIIGSCVTVGGFAIGKISGGSLNPAVSVGIVSVDGGLMNCVYYVCAELAAGAIAAKLFMVTQPSEYEDQGILPGQKSAQYGSTKKSTDIDPTTPQGLKALFGR